MLTRFDMRHERLDAFKTDYLAINEYELPPHYEGIYRTYEFARLYCIIHGSQNFKTASHSWTMDRHEALLIPAYSKIAVTGDRHCHVLVFELYDTLIDDVLHKLSLRRFDLQQAQKSNEVILNLHQTPIAETIKRLLQLGTSPTRADSFSLDLSAQQLIFDLIGYETAGQALAAPAKEPMEKAIRLIRNHIDESLSIEDIAHHFNMSLSNFSHTFKRYTGKSPMAFIRDAKLDYSLILLEELSVTDTALELGYETPSYFIRRFKERHQMTPKQYQRRFIQL